MSKENYIVTTVCGIFAVLCFCVIKFLLVPTPEANMTSRDLRHDGSPEPQPQAASPTQSFSHLKPFDPNAAAEQVMAEISSTPSGRDEISRIGTKDDQLSEFQRQHGISDAIAEAAIKEWVLTHDGNFDFDLDQVKAICLRLARN